jgi:hyaluronan synthase
LSFYKREAIQDFIHEWANDRFLGMDFKFCTDRRMTAYVLATSPTPNPFVSNPNVFEVDIPILQTGHDDIETLKATIDSDTEYPIRRMRNWNVKYSQKIRVNVGVPNTLSALIKQQIRWKKSFIRSLSSTGGVYWKRPAYIALLFYIQTAMKFIRPYIVFHALFMLPFEGDLLSTILWISGILYTGMIYAVDFRLRNPRNKLWLYRPVFTLLTTFLYTWLLPYAAITIRNRSWR